jgi:hypothetical protein
MTKKFKECGKCGGEGYYRASQEPTLGYVTCSICGNKAHMPYWDVEQQMIRMERENAVALAMLSAIYDKSGWVDFNAVIVDAKKAVELQDAAWRERFREKSSK